MALVAEQILQKLEFASGQIQQCVASGDSPRHEIQLQIRGFQAQHIRRPASPEERANSREQLWQGEGLDQVVVSSEIEAQDSIINAVARRQNQDRRLDAPLPERL